MCSCALNYNVSKIYKRQNWVLVDDVSLFLIFFQDDIDGKEALKEIWHNTHPSRSPPGKVSIKPLTDIAPIHRFPGERGSVGACAQRVIVGRLKATVRYDRGIARSYWNTNVPTIRSRFGCRLV